MVELAKHLQNFFAMLGCVFVDSSAILQERLKADKPMNKYNRDTFYIHDQVCYCWRSHVWQGERLLEALSATPLYIFLALTWLLLLLCLSVWCAPSRPAKCILWSIVAWLMQVKGYTDYPFLEVSPFSVRPFTISCHLWHTPFGSGKVGKTIHLAMTSGKISLI